MKKKPNQTPEQIAPDSDEHFACIAGYTGGGVPYGVTWEEMEADECSAVDDTILWSNRIVGEIP